MRVAITGATGFIGQRVAAVLQGQGHDVRGLSRAPATASDPAMEWICGSLQDSRAVDALVGGVDAVVHAAVDDASAKAGGEANWSSNLMASLNLLEASRRAHVPQFVFVSSVAVYHQQVKGLPWDERHPAWPDTDYGAYKACVELYLKMYAQQYGMNTSAWRPGVVYGIRHPLSASRWYALAAQVLSGQSCDLRPVRKVAHVDDVAEALALAIGDTAVAGESFNLVDASVSWQAIAHAIRELSGAGAAAPPIGGALAKRDYDAAKAMRFFDRHGRAGALRRGFAGVRNHLDVLVQAIQRASPAAGPEAI